MPKTSLSRLRWVGRLEAISFLLLLGIAMPLKYFADLPIATRIVGWPHGLLFVLYCYLVIEAAAEHGFKPKFTVALFIAALLPFGPFIAERGLPAQER